MVEEEERGEVEQEEVELGGVGLEGDQQGEGSQLREELEVQRLVEEMQEALGELEVVEEPEVAVKMKKEEVISLLSISRGVRSVVET